MKKDLERISQTLATTNNALALSLAINELCQIQRASGPRIQKQCMDIVCANPFVAEMIIFKNGCMIQA